MKRAIIFIYTLISLSLNGQSITYFVNKTPTVIEMPYTEENIPSEAYVNFSQLKIIGKYTTYKPISTLNKEEKNTIFTNNRAKELTNDSLGNLHITIKREYIERYIDNENKTLTSIIYKDRFYRIQERLPNLSWRITKSGKIINDYVCQKAQTVIKGQHVDAWFTKEIPIKSGPDEYYGLPGLILEVKTKDKHIIMKSIRFSNNAQKFEVPNKGVDISRKDFETKIRKEKEDKAIRDAINFFNY